MRTLIACEESQAVCIEFRKRGHEAYSCDIQESSGGHPEWHINDNVLDVINGGVFNTESGDTAIIKKWDIMIGFPPCTYLSYAGTRHWNNPGRLEKRLDALGFFSKLWLAPIDKICLENPRGCASPTIAKYSQLVNPYYFGDSFSKPTCLFLKNLPLLQHVKQDNLFEKSTHVDKGEFVEFVTKKGKIKKESKWYRELGGKGKERSKTFPGIAKAMAEQWGNLK